MGLFFTSDLHLGHSSQGVGVKMRVLPSHNSATGGHVVVPPPLLYSSFNPNTRRNNGSIFS